MPPASSDGNDRTAVVVGAGLGGLAAALELRRAGCKVSVFERAARLSEVDTGLTLYRTRRCFNTGRWHE